MVRPECRDELIENCWFRARTKAYSGARERSAEKKEVKHHVEKMTNEKL